MCPSYELWKWQLTSVSTATAALVGIGAWPKNDLTLVAAGFSANDSAIASATGDVVGRFSAEDGTVIHYR
jgi:DNA-binding transcriptional regulator LsrR (DeoR family)